MTPKWLKKKLGPDITKPVPIGPLATPLPDKPKNESPAWRDLNLRARRTGTMRMFDKTRRG